MRAVVQRVRQGSVTVAGQVVGKIDGGLVVLLGIGQEDTPTDAHWLADKIVGLRIFADDQGKMNRSLTDVKGAVLVVSQFTLFGDCQKGRRPSFIAAAGPETAVPLYEAFLREVQLLGVPVATGVFGAMMDVALVNDGPVTLILDSDTKKKPGQSE